jgi:hypothetical protein
VGSAASGGRPGLPGRARTGRPRLDPRF